MLTNKYSNKQLIYEFTKSLYYNIGFFKNYITQFHNYYQWNMMPDSNLFDIHQGSKQLYREKGFISDTIHSKEIFNKYGNIEF